MLLMMFIAVDTLSILEGGNESADVDKTTFSIEAIAEMREVVSELTDLRDATDDNVRSTCLDGKRQRVADLVDGAETASSKTIDHIAAGEDAKAEHEFRKVGVALVRARQLHAEAAIDCVVSEQDEHAAEQMGWTGSQAP